MTNEPQTTLQERLENRYRCPECTCGCRKCQPENFIGVPEDIKTVKGLLGHKDKQTTDNPQTTRLLCKIGLHNWLRWYASDGSSERQCLLCGVFNRSGKPHKNIFGFWSRTWRVL